MAEEGGPTPQELLFRAAKTGRFDDFRQILFSSKLRLNVTDGLGNTALHYAAAGDHPAICKFILKTDPQVINIPNNIGDTPLHKVRLFAIPCHTNCSPNFHVLSLWNRPLAVPNPP